MKLNILSVFYKFYHFTVRTKIVKRLIMSGFFRQSLTCQPFKSDAITGKCCVYLFCLEATLSQVIGLSDTVGINGRMYMYLLL